MTLREALAPIKAMSPEEVHAYLAGLGVKGQRNNCYRCPLAEYVNRVCGLDPHEESVRVGLWCISLEDEKVGHSDNMEEFISMFDSGYYPDIDSTAE